MNGISGCSGELNLLGLRVFLVNDRALLRRVLFMGRPSRSTHTRFGFLNLLLAVPFFQ